MQLALGIDGIAQPDAVFTPGNLFGARFLVVRQGGMLLAQLYQLAVFILQLAERSKGLP